MSTPKKRYVASIAVFNSDGLLLFGLRSDTNKWCLPGGHFEDKEHPSQAALRELYEETGIVPDDAITFLGDAEPKEGIHVFSFRVTSDTQPDASEDPDGEFTEFQFVDPKNIPAKIADRLHNNPDVTLEFLKITPKVTKSEGKFWRCRDGLRIPHATHPKRAIWNEVYDSAVRKAFAKNGESIEYHDIDVSKVKGYNMPVNQARLSLYKRMLMGGETLPPIVVRIDNDGIALIDGCHRQEACVQTGTKMVKAAVVLGNDLQKGLGLSLLLGAGMTMGTPNFKEPPQPTVHSIEPGVGVKTWTPEGLPDEMLPIAHLESSFGQNMKHAPHPAGEYHTAYGAVGFKPSSAHEVWRKSPAMQKQYPGLNDPADFLKTFKADPKFYNQLAGKYWDTLKAYRGSPEEAARSWRYGLGAVHNKAPEAMADKEGYVAKYKAMLSAKVKPAEPPKGGK